MNAIFELPGGGKDQQPTEIALKIVKLLAWSPISRAVDEVKVILGGSEVNRDLHFRIITIPLRKKKSHVLNYTYELRIGRSDESKKVATTLEQMVQAKL